MSLSPCFHWYASNPPHYDPWDDRLLFSHRPNCSCTVRLVAYNDEIQLQEIIQARHQGLAILPPPLHPRAAGEYIPYGCDHHYLDNPATLDLKNGIIIRFATYKVLPTGASEYDAFDILNLEHTDEVSLDQIQDALKWFRLSHRTIKDSVVVRDVLDTFM